MMMRGGVALGLMLLAGCVLLESKKSDSLNQQERSSVAAIERREAAGAITGTEAAVEKNAVTNNHVLSF